MSTVDANTVLNVAKLAYLTLSESEISHYAEQLQGICVYMQEINNIDFDLGENDSRAINEADDIVKASFNPNKLIKHAPESSGTSFVVPRIMD